MTIVIKLDKALAKAHMQSKELAERMEFSEVNLSRLKTGKIKAIRFSTLNKLCRELKCKPGDIIDYIDDDISGSDSEES